MKLSLSVNLFDGEELLEANLLNKREFCFHISVIYQEISYYGNSHQNKNLKEFLDSLVKKGLIDELVLFNPNLTLFPAENEQRKRNIGLELAKKARATHYICCDCDEFYEKEQFQYMLDYYKRHDLDFAVCPLIDYYEVVLRSKYPRDMTFTSTPLIIKISDNLFQIGCVDLPHSVLAYSSIKKGSDNLFQIGCVDLPHSVLAYLSIKKGNCLSFMTRMCVSVLRKMTQLHSIKPFDRNVLRIDSTRIPIFKSDNIKVNIFNADEVIMHHMFLVRRDFYFKKNNSSTSKNFVNEKINFYLNNKDSNKKFDYFVETENIFNINL